MIIFILLIILACYVSYKESKLHELHKLRANFDSKYHDIEKILNEDKFNKDFLNGELKGLEDAIESLSVEGEKRDLLTEINNDIYSLKIKIENLFK